LDGVSRIVDGGSTVARRVIQRIVGWALVAGCTAGAVRHVAIGGDAAWLAIWGFYAAVGAVLLWWASMQAREQQGEQSMARNDETPRPSRRRSGASSRLAALWAARRLDRKARELEEERTREAFRRSEENRKLFTD
jgi:hypothetical protein